MWQELEGGLVGNLAWSFSQTLVGEAVTLSLKWG